MNKPKQAVNNQPKPRTAARGELSSGEAAVMEVFRKYLVGPGEMVCFPGPLAQQHEASLKRLADRDLLVKESFHAGYSLTKTGFRAMRGAS